MRNSSRVTFSPSITVRKKNPAKAVVTLHERDFNHVFAVTNLALTKERLDAHLTYA